MKRGKRDTTRNISCTVLHRFPLQFMLYRGNLDYFSNSVLTSILTSHSIITVLYVVACLLISSCILPFITMDFCFPPVTDIFQPSVAGIAV